MASLAEVRKAAPNLSHLSDYQIADIYAQGEGISPQLARYDLGIENQGDTGDVMRGAYQAGNQLVGSGQGLVGMVGGLADSVGIPGAAAVKQWGLEHAKARFDKADTYSRPGDDVDNLSWDTAGTFVKHGLGYVGAQLAPAILTGGLGSFIAKRAITVGVETATKEAAMAMLESGATKAEIEHALGTMSSGMLAQASGRGALAGAGASSYMQEAGSIYPEQIKEGNDNPWLAAGMAVPAAALDLVGEAPILGRLFKGVPGSKMFTNRASTSTKDGVMEVASERGFWANRAIASAKVGALEGTTEGAQTVLERIGAGQSLNDADAWHDYRNSAALGAFGGHVMGAVVGQHAAPQAKELQDKLAQSRPVDLLQGQTADMFSGEHTFAAAPGTQETASAPFENKTGDMFRHATIDANGMPHMDGFAEDINKWRGSEAAYGQAAQARSAQRDKEHEKAWSQREYAGQDAYNQSDANVKGAEAAAARDYVVQAAGETQTPSAMAQAFAGAKIDLLNRESAATRQTGLQQQLDNHLDARNISPAEHKADSELVAKYKLGTVTDKLAEYDARAKNVAPPDPAAELQRKANVPDTTEAPLPEVPQETRVGRPVQDADRQLKLRQVNTLTPRDKSIVSDMIGWDTEGSLAHDPMTVDAVAEKHGITKGRVSQITKKLGLTQDALARLRSDGSALADTHAMNDVLDGHATADDAGMQIMDRPSDTHVVEDIKTRGDTVGANRFAQSRGVNSRSLNQPIEDNVVTAGEQDILDRNAEKAAASAHAENQAILEHPDANNAAADWNDFKAAEAPAFEHLTHHEQAAWVETYRDALREDDPMAAIETAQKQFEKELDHGAVLATPDARARIGERSDTLAPGEQKVLPRPRSESDATHPDGENTGVLERAAGVNLSETAGVENPHTKESLEQALSKLFFSSKFLNRIVKVYAKQSDAVAKGALSEKLGRVGGWQHGDSVGLIAENIAKGKELGVILHEIGVHLGMEKLVGKDNMVWLQDRVVDWAKRNDGSVECRVAKEAIKRAEKSSSANKDEERIAYMVEGLVKAGINPQAHGTTEGHQWFRKLWAATKAALRQLGFKNPDNFTPQQLVNLAYGAAHLELGSTDGAGTQRVADFWKAVASNPRAFLYGTAEKSATSAQDIADQMSTDRLAVKGKNVGDGANFFTEDGLVHVFPANDKRNSEGGFAKYMIQSPGANSAGKLSGGGSLMYQAALKWVHANGGEFVKDDHLTDINKLRVTSNMLSSALREKTTDHLDIDSEQGIIGWKKGDTDNNIAALATRESELSHERIPELNNYSYDPSRNAIVDEGGTVVQPDEVRKILARVDPNFTQGVGVATFARALGTRAALRGAGALGRDGGIGVQQAGIAFGERKVLYSEVASDTQHNAQVLMQSVKDNAYHLYKKGLAAAVAGHDLISIAVKDGLKTAEGFFNLTTQKDAIRNQVEKETERVLNMTTGFSAAERATAVTFLRESTVRGKWGFKPTWMKDEDWVSSGQKIDAGMEARFKALPTQAMRDTISAVFEQSHVMQGQIRDLLNADIHAEYDQRIKDATDPEEAEKLVKSKAAAIKESGKLLPHTNGPYAPLKRFGDHVVTARSKAYIEAEAAQDTETMNELIAKQEGDYVVKMYDSAGEAKAEQRRLMAEYGEGAKYALKLDMLNSTDALPWANVLKLKQSINGAADTKYKAAMQRIVLELYLNSVAETSARKSEITRKGGGVEGSDDMFRAFAAHGQANAHYIAALSGNKKINNQLALMRAEAKDQGPDATVAYNEILKRYAQSIDYRPTPWINKAMRVTSISMLALTPAYYLQNSMQTFMFTMPVLGGKYGGRAFGEITKAYGQVAGAIKNMKGDLNIDDLKISDAEKVFLKDLQTKGKLNIGINAEMGRWTRTGGNSQSAAATGMDNVMRHIDKLMVQVELLNRTTAALAAFRLSGGDATYSEHIVDQTHGNYAASNAPRAFNTNIGKLMLQFRKYQLIQISLLVGLAHQSFKGATPQERDAGRAALSWLLVQHLAITGMAGTIPAGLMAIAGALGGDDDKDWKRNARAAIGDDDAANFILNGIPAGLGLDLSRKLGISGAFSLLPFADMPTDQNSYEKALTAASGAFFGGIGPQAFSAFAHMSKGDYYKGVETALPKGLSNAMKAYRFSTEGVTTGRGDTLLSGDKVSTLAALSQALGLPTTVTSNFATQRNDLYELGKHFKDQESELKDRYTAAHKEGDTGEMADLRKEWTDHQAAKQRWAATMREEGFRDPKLLTHLKPEPLSSLLKAPRAQGKRERPWQSVEAR